jgi:hypothetical protein
MNSRLLRYIIFFLVTSGADADPQCVVGDITTGLSEEEAAVLNSFGPSWIKKANVCVMGRYKIAVPADGVEETIFIWTDDEAYFMNEKGLGVSIYGKGPDVVTSDQLVNVQDRDKNGVYDQIKYRVFSGDGKPLMDVFDMNMDGEVDKKIYVPE